MTCNIEPQILNVAVDYNAAGYLTCESLGQTSTNAPINFTSTVISTIMSALEYHLSDTQAPSLNVAVEGLFDLYDNAYPQDSNYTVLANLMVGLPFSVISRN